MGGGCRSKQAMPIKEHSPAASSALRPRAKRPGARGAAHRSCGARGLAFATRQQFVSVLPTAPVDRYLWQQLFGSACLVRPRIFRREREYTVQRVLCTATTSA